MLLVIVVVGTGLFAALVAMLWSRQKAKSQERFRRSKYHGIPTDDLDEDRFSFQDDGINLIGGDGGGSGGGRGIDFRRISGGGRGGGIDGGMGDGIGGGIGGGGKYRTGNRGRLGTSSPHSSDDVLIDLGDDSGSDFVLSDFGDEEDEEDVENGNIADVDDMNPYHERDDFRVDGKSGDEFDVELSDDDTGFAGW